MPTTRTAPDVHVSEEVISTADQIVQFLRDGVVSVNIVMDGEFVAPGHNAHYADELLRRLDFLAVKPEKFHINYPRRRAQSFVIVITREVEDKSIPASAA